MPSNPKVSVHIETGPGALSRVVTFRVTEAQYQELRAAAKKAGQSVSNFARAVVTSMSQEEQ